MGTEVCIAIAGIVGLVFAGLSEVSIRKITSALEENVRQGQALTREMSGALNHRPADMRWQELPDWENPFIRSAIALSFENVFLKRERRTAKLVRAVAAVVAANAVAYFLCVYGIL